MTAFGEFTGLLIHTALVYRREQEGGTYKRDPFGQPARTEDFSHMLECRITAARGGEQFTDRSHDVVQATHNLFLDRAADLSEEDVVTVVGAGVNEINELLEDEPEADPAEEFHNIVTKAEVLLARVNYDSIGEHHREVKLSNQRQSGQAR